VSEANDLQGFELLIPDDPQAEDNSQMLIQIGAEMLFSRLVVLDPEEVGAKIGKPLTLDTEKVRRIVLNIATGATVEVAARAAGVVERQLYRWRERGRALIDELDEHPRDVTEEEWMLVYFEEMIRIAEAGAEIALLNIVLRGGERGAKWILERRFPQRWAPRPAPQRIEHDHVIRLVWPEQAREIIDVTPESEQLEAPHAREKEEENGPENEVPF